MSTNVSATAGASEFLALKRPQMMRAGADDGSKLSKKDLLAALGQNSDGDSVGAVEKTGKTLSKLDGSEETASSASQPFSSLVGRLLFQDDPANGTGEESGVATLSQAASVAGASAPWAASLAQGGGSATAATATAPTADTAAAGGSSGRLDSRMMAVLLQHQAA